MIASIYKKLYKVAPNTTIGLFMNTSNKKIGRNHPCPCGSGKKYKKCCLQKVAQKNHQYNTLDKQIHDASGLFLENNKKSIVDSIEKLSELLTRPNLSPEQKVTIQLNLAQAYQHYGKHNTALETLNSIKAEINNNKVNAVLIKELKAVSYCALGYHQKSCDIFDDVLNELEHLEPDPKLEAFICIEAGKAFHTNKNIDKAKECWEKSLKFFENDKEDIIHYTRVKANLGLLYLKSIDEKRQEEGIKLLEESSDLKRRTGDLEGLANNYSNLGTYYCENKRYERAIAYLRMDLKLSRMVGNQRAIASTLGNLACLYADLKQLSPARQLLNEAKQIGVTLKDTQLIKIANHNLEYVDTIGKNAGQKGEKTGLTADCMCGSGKEYQNCCGQADFEPVDIPFQFDNASEDLKEIVKYIEAADEEYWGLDFILRETNDSKTRTAWSRMEVHDGWLKMSELPDMANHHLISAKILAEEAKSEPDSVTKSLSCIILCACALEAFINQIAFFLNEYQGHPEYKKYSIPPEIKGDVMKFQRYTELTNKWDILGKTLCGDYWKPSDSLLTDFRNLIYIRNKLVHFKAVDYEQIIPPMKSLHDVMKRVPESIEIRNIPRSWPLRLLTPSFANWCINNTESMIDYFKESYYKNRLDRAHQKVKD